MRSSIPDVKIRFLTSTPLDVRRGSGTYVGMYVLAGALENLGHTVKFESPRHSLPIYTLQRLIFNRSLRRSAEFDLTVGFDMDGYLIAANSPGHVASLKGVIADEVRFETGMTRLTMSLQARREMLHVQRAAKVLVTSRYSAERAVEYYQLARVPDVVPELIDLAQWRKILGPLEAQSGHSRFVVLFVGRFYLRKRVDVLLRAAAILRHTIPRLDVRIVGNGPCGPGLHRLARDLNLGDIVHWLGDVSRAQLAHEYTHCDVFCLPSVQEGFGIVLLEAMAAGKPIVAARAAAIPEVVPHGVLVDPGSAEALAAGLESVYRLSDRGAHLRTKGFEWVEQFDAPLIARQFLAAASPQAN
jgi:glycosyltransferase involved in cell wall biosynthesis